VASIRNRRSIARFAIHGLPVELESHLPALDRAVTQQLGLFAVDDWPEGFSPVQGWIGRYEVQDVLRHVSSSALRISAPDASTEVYREQERLWLVDQRWGMAELNLLRGQLRSWVLPAPAVDPMRCAELAVMEPLAHLLRQRGLWLLPAVSAVREGFGVLIISNISIRPELQAMLRAGYRLVSQRWTALREEDGQIELLHMPGPAMFGSRAAPGLPAGEWVDLMSEANLVSPNHACCHGVVLVSSVRRTRAHLARLPIVEAIQSLRRNWPLPELDPLRRQNLFPSRMARQCRVAEARLSHQRHDMLWLLESLQHAADTWPAEDAEPTLSRLAG
jgi:hypothetical protein